MQSALHGTGGLLIGYGIVTLGVLIGMILDRAMARRVMLFPFVAIPALVVIAIAWSALVSLLKSKLGRFQEILGMDFFMMAGGREALKSRTRRGASGLDEAQRRELMRALIAGALAEGFATDLRTLPCVGRTPILQHHFNCSQLSVIAGITFRRFYFRVFPGAIMGPQIIEFLNALGQQIRQPLLVIWDGLAAHRFALVRGYLDALNGAVQIEQLRAYAPELNPTEYIWGHLKHHELANRRAADFHDLKSGARNRLRSMQRRSTLVRAFWRQADRGARSENMPELTQNDVERCIRIREG